MGFLRALVELDEKQSASLPDEHPDHLVTLERLTLTSLMGGNLEAALVFQRRIADIHRTTSGPSSEATRTALRGVPALTPLDPTRVAESEAANAELLAAEEAAWGPDSPRLLPTRVRQYDLLTALKEKKAAFGLQVPIWIELEIEDIEAELARLKIELETEGTSDTEEQSAREVFEDFKFQDREILQAELLSSSANHIELYGPSGVGKTYLLRHIANGHESIQKVYIDLKSHLEIDEIWLETVRQLRDQVNELRELVEQKRN